MVILDVNLKDAHGLALIAPIRKASPNTQVIIMSGMDDPAAAALAVKEGAIAYLSKPIDLQALAKALAGNDLIY